MALGIVFWAGVLFLIVSATPLREQIATGDSCGPAAGDCGGHRPAAHAAWLAQRRLDRI